MKEELLLLNKKIFRLIELAKKPNIEFSRSDDKINKFLYSLILLYKKRISSGKDSLEDILHEIESSFYSKEYQMFFIQQVNNDVNIKRWDIINLDSLIQSYKRTNKDFKQFEQWQEAKKRNKNSTVGFFKKRYKETKIDYYCLKLGFDNYSQAKKYDFDVNKKDKQEEESISVLEKLIKLVESSLDNLENEILKIKNSVGDNTIEEKEKINIITKKVTHLIDESSSNFTILERNQEYINQELLDRQKNINNELESIIEYNTELKTKLEKAKKEIIDNQNKSSLKVFKLIKLSNKISISIGLIIVILLIVILKPPCYQKIVNGIDYYFTNFQTTNPNSCKILILPFNGLDQCKEKPAKYEEVLELRYRELRIKYNFDIEIISLESVDPPKDEEKVRKIGEEKKADIIIWGDYAENCRDSSKISVKYVALKNINREMAFLEGKDKFYGNSGVTSLNSIYDLKEGNIPRDIDYVVLWSCINPNLTGETTKNLKSFVNAIKDFNFLDTRLFLTMARNTWVENSVKNNYDLTKSIYGLALRYELKQDLSKVLSLEKIIELSDLENNKTVRDIWIELVYIMMSDEKYKEGLFFSKKIVKKIPEDTQAWHSLGNFQFYTLDTINAEKSFLKAIELDSTNINALNNLGLLMAKSKRMKEAKRVFKKVVKKDSSNIGSLIGLGTILADEKNFRDAKKIFEKVIKKDSININALTSLGRILADEENYKEAVKYFHRILAITPKSNKILYYLGKAYYFNKQYKQSLIYFRKVHDSSKYIYDTSIKKGICSFMLGRNDNAEKYFKKAIQNDSIKTEGYIYLLKLYITEKKILKAYNILKTLDNLNYRIKQLHYYMGQLLLYARVSKKEERIEFFKGYMRDSYLELERLGFTEKDINLAEISYFELVSFYFKESGEKSEEFEEIKKYKVLDCLISDLIK